MKVETGVIAAAGSGTRMLPVTLGYPKELLPIINKPAIQLIVDEYIDSGLKKIIIVTGANPDPGLRSTVASQLASLANTRLTNFAKDHPWQGDIDNPGGISANPYARRFNCARNFTYMTPALGAAMRSSAQASTIVGALNEYEYVCPQWFIARDSNTFAEGSAHHIFDSHALFLAKAYVAAQPQSELSKWLDVPWMLGDLYYIQNVVAALEAGGGT